MEEQAKEGVGGKGGQSFYTLLLPLVGMFPSLVTQISLEKYNKHTCSNSVPFSLPPLQTRVYFQIKRHLIDVSAPNHGGGFKKWCTLTSRFAVCRNSKVDSCMQI